MFLLEKIDDEVSTCEYWYAENVMVAARYVYWYYKDREELTYDREEDNSEIIAAFWLSDFEYREFSIKDFKLENMRSMENLFDVPPFTFDTPSAAIAYLLVKGKIYDFALRPLERVPTV